VPAVVLSAGVHGALLLALPWVGQAVLAPPAPGPQPLAFVEVGDIGLPGSGIDPLSGPAGVLGGSPFGTRAGPAVPGGVDPVVAVPGSAVAWLEAYEANDPKTPVPSPQTWHEHTPSEPGLTPPPSDEGVADVGAPSASSDGLRIERGIDGVPVPTAAAVALVPEQEPVPRPPIVDDEAAAIRAAMLRDLLDGGAEVIDAPIGLGSPSGEGGAGPFSGAGSRFGTVPDPELLLWQRLVREQLMERFQPLPSLAEANPELTATVAMTLGPGGAVLAREVRVSSGNPSFDAAALWAVDDGPLPPPPEGWADVLRTQGLAVRFTPSPVGF